MKPLEGMLSPIIKKRDGIILESLDKDESLLIKRIKQQKKEILKEMLSEGIESSLFEFVRPEIVESWIRSYYYGLDPCNFKDGPVLDKAELEELVSQESSFIKVADIYIQKLRAMLSDTNYLILLTDEHGVFLRVVIGNRKVLQHVNKKFHLAPGVVWAESTVGTCSHVMCRLLKRPVQLCGPEFYSQVFYDAACSSAPILDLYGNLSESLTIVSPFSCHQNPHSLALAASTAWAIQNEMRLALSKELLNVTLETADEAIITVNKSGVISSANLKARKVLNCLDKDIVGVNVEAVLGVQPLINTVLETGNTVLDADIEIQESQQKLYLRSAQPIKDHRGKIFGCVLTLEKIDQGRRISRQASGLKTRFTFDKIIGTSAQLARSINVAKRFARLDANILIQGESGTGKEVFAQSIHNESRPDGPFIAINCAAIPKTLIESELFGYEGGAFTGAERYGRPGKIELANTGTLFLDEIGDMPLELQPVFLRVLEEKKVMRVGGSRYVPVDFRLITATNKNLLDLVKKNLFREDLYYRLEACKINIPPLRERGLDIIRLAKHFIDSIAKKQHIPAPALSNAAIFHLLKYSWPGNVRQLENAMLYAVNMSSDGVIRPEDLPEEISGMSVSHDKGDAEFNVGSTRRIQNNLSIREMEIVLIIQTLLQTRNNISEAAKILGMSRSTLYRKVKEYNLLDEVRIRT